MSLDLSRLRVVVADDHPILLGGLAALLNSAEGIDLVGQAENGSEAVRLILDLQPSVAVIDLSMPEANGIEVIEQVIAAGCPTRLIILSVHENRIYVQRAIAAGAHGYVLKRSTGENLLHAIYATSAGGTYIDPNVAAQHVAASDPPAVRGPQTRSAASPALTSREEDVLRYVAHGFTSKEIAPKLGIASKSVETYKMRATRKLGIIGRAKLVQFAHGNGWLTDK